MAYGRVLVVEPDQGLRQQLVGVAAALADTDADAGLPAARTRVLSKPYRWLITNIRLDAYNGLHLAYLAGLGPGATRILVYGEPEDAVLARQAQRLGAFFEPRGSVTETLPGYLLGALPATDRRAADRGDRRATFRGGRRCSDVVWALPRGVKPS